jgi:AcrR family transcriptional regulator
VTEEPASQPGTDVDEADVEPRVLDAVARILERDGLGALSISAIAAAADLSRVTLHRRGLTVERCVVAVIGRASDDLRASLWPVLTGPGDGATRLSAALAVLCEVTERHAGVMRAVYGVPARPIPGRPGRTTSLEFIEPFERLVRDGLADGSLRSGDPRRDATLVANVVCWTYLHMRLAHRWATDDAVAEVVGLATARIRTG